MKRTVTASSSRENATGWLAGSARQPWGRVSAASAVAAPLPWLSTVTLTSRVGRAPALGTAAGTIRISGVAETANFGTTCSSARFSPLKMLPSERDSTFTGTVSASPPTTSARLATNGVGRNGSPGGTSGSSTNCAAVAA